MTRPMRIEYPGALYHITSRGNEKRAIFYNDGDRNCFLLTLGEIIKKHNWICHSYCLMSNHYHLLIETPEGNLSGGMQQLNGIYGIRFNSEQSDNSEIPSIQRNILTDEQLDFLILPDQISLEDRNKLILGLHYKNGVKIGKIAKLVSLHYSRVSKIITKSKLETQGKI